MSDMDKHIPMVGDLYAILERPVPDLMYDKPNDFWYTFVEGGLPELPAGMAWARESIQRDPRLTIPTGFDDEGEPTGWRTVKAIRVNFVVVASE